MTLPAPWLRLAQAVEASGPAAGGDGLLYLVWLLAFLSVFTFVFLGFLLFSTGWESYEEKYLEGAERTLDDLFLTIPPQQLLWLSLLGGFSFFVLGFLISGSVVFGLVFGAPGTLLPRLILALKKRQRAAKFKQQLVDAMGTLTNALRTGFSLPKAFQLIAHDMPKPICQEFGILVQELRLGIDVEEGLDNMLERMPSEDLDLVVTSVSISNSVGGNLAEVFERIAHTIRERTRIEGRIDSLTAQGKMQGILVSVLPFFVGGMLYVIDPHLMEPMFHDPRGLAVLGLMLVMEALGFFFIRKITNIEV
ncbi:MAG: secretion system protein [Planctomycetota bacterium]|nr:MAG: secretion system protein [Planctomycetota bacterium]